MKILLSFLIFIVSLFFFKEVQAYNSPIGVPDPGFGIEDSRPNRPESWTSEIPGYYYINYETGTNTGRSYGTPANPRQTIPNPIPAGSYVEINGTYNYLQGGVIIIYGNGNGSEWVANTSGPVWVVGENQQSKPEFTRTVLTYGSYVYVDAIKLSDLGKFQIGSATAGRPADHIVLRNSEGQGIVTGGSLLSLVGSSADLVSNVVVYNNVLHDAGDINADYDQDSHITTVSNYSSNVWFLENTLYASSGSGAQVGGAYNGYENCHHIYYGKNHVYNTRQAGLAVKYASDVVYSQNIIHDTVYTSWSVDKGIGFQYAPNRVWILYNHIYNCSYGIYAGSTNATPPDWYVYVIGNVIHDIEPDPSFNYNPENSWAPAGIMMAGGTYKHIINNTLYKVVGGIYCPSSVAHFMENNIISEVTRDDGYHIFMDTGVGASLSTLNNNIFFQTGREEKIKWSSSYVGNLSYIQSNAGVGQNSFDTDPQFIDVLTNNFRLGASSPAMDSGVAHEVYTTFQTLYGIDIAKDFTNASRPINGTFDIGAYEFAGVDAVSPGAPNGLAVL